MSYVETASLKNSTIMLLYAERDEICINPFYQRMGDVWTLEKKRLLIDSILNDYDIPKIYFHAYDNEEISRTGFRYAVIDGRQRLEAIWGFMDGVFTLSKDFEYQREPTLDLGGLSYSDIAKRYPKIRVKFDSFVLPIITVSIEGNDLDLIEDMFSRLNEAVPLNAAEKRNALGGALVHAIRTVADEPFFRDRVRFTNKRFQHREVAARFLLLEDSLSSFGKIIDTKKVYLDDLARRYANNPARANELKDAVTSTIGYMADEFTNKDELLLAQGSMSVYYLIFKFAAENNELHLVTRRRLLDFRDKLAENRELAIANYAESSFDLLEYDRLNQQGTNDASGIKERYSILATELGLTRAELA